MVYNKDAAREARPEGKGRRMYRERKSRTPAKTVTHFLKAVYEKWPGASYQLHHRAKPNNRVKPIIQELTRKVKRGQYEEVQSFRDHAQGMEAVPQGHNGLCRVPAPGVEQCKGSFPSGSHPFQQGRRPDLPRVILWGIPSEAPKRLKQTANLAAQEKPAGSYFERRF